MRRTRQPSMFFRDVTDTNQSESHSGHQQLRFTSNYMGAWRTWRRPPTSSLLLDWSCRRTRRRKRCEKPKVQPYVFIILERLHKNVLTSVRHLPTNVDFIMPRNPLVALIPSLVNCTFIQLDGAVTVVVNISTLSQLESLPSNNTLSLPSSTCKRKQTFKRQRIWSCQKTVCVHVSSYIQLWWLVVSRRSQKNSINLVLDMNSLA